MGVSSTRNAISRSKSRCGPCVAHAGMRKVGSLCCAVRVRLPYSGRPPSDGRLVYAKHHFSIQIVLWPLRGAHRHAESGRIDPTPVNSLFYFSKINIFIPKPSKFIVLLK